MLTGEYIQSIIDSDNLVVRNLQVTQGYYLISQGMKRYTSGKNVSWCSFATHASKTAGQALRHELMPGYLKSTMIRMFETGQDTLSGSGAENWGDLGDRMSFVVDFFRSHQQYKRMWERPFLSDQAAVIESGHFPGGPL